MPYNIENIFICLAAPCLLAALGTNTGNRKNYIFIVLGFVCCIISAYLNTFFSVLYGAQETSAVLEISPVIEETVKLIPLLFGLMGFYHVPLLAEYFSAFSSCLGCCVWGGLSVCWKFVVPLYCGGCSLWVGLD